MPSDVDLQATSAWSDLLMGISWVSTHVELGDTVTRAAGHGIWRLATSLERVQSYLSHDDANNTETARDLLASVPMFVRFDLDPLNVVRLGRWTSALD